MEERARDAKAAASPGALTARSTITYRKLPGGESRGPAFYYQSHALLGGTSEVRMQITRQADYAVRAVSYLAQLGPGQRATTAEISQKQKIPLTFLAKIVAQLAVAGVVHTTRGAHGGMWLARPAETVSLLEVVETIDGPLALNACVLDPAACELSDNCAVRAVWCEAQSDLARRLAQSNFGQLAHAARPASQPATAAAML